MSRWSEARFGLERSCQLGMALRRREPKSPKKSLLWVHGLGESGLCFEELICDPRLDAYDHLVPDLIGYGKSTWAEEPLGVEDHAARLEQLLDHSRMRRVVVVGHSMGGVIGLYLGRRLGRRIEALVNVEGNISADDCTASRTAARSSLEDWLESDYDAFLDEHYGELCKAGQRRPGAGVGDSTTVIRRYGASIQMADPRAFHRNSRDLVRESDSETMASRLGKLDIPQIYVHGAPRGTGSHSLELLRRAGIRSLPIEPAGHWPYLDQPDDFVDLLTSYLQTLP